MPLATLEDFDPVELVDEDALRRVFRGVSPVDGASVLLKVPAGVPPAAGSIERLRREYAFLRDLVDASVPQVRAWFEQDGAPLLVLDDIGGRSLQQMLAAGPLSVDRFFDIALGLVDALDGVHRANVVHRDLRPRNVIVNLSPLQIQIVDFGAASNLPRELCPPMMLDEMGASLAYLSPEQTGRTSRQVDYRADYYALGATFYEMLTGEPPFVAQNALELVYCHLARTPVSPSERRPAIPSPLSAIVLKLLAKLAEDRYQSAAGLRHDLRRAHREWQAAGEIEPFALGSADRSERFLLTQRLFGREREVATLRAAFERVAASGRAELVLIRGHAGAGKSRLVAELQNAVLGRSGHFVQGRVDQYRQGLPYEVIVEALRELIRQVLSEPSARIAVWRERLREALGPESQAIVELVPQLRLVIGSSAPKTEGAQAQADLQRALKRFIAVAARAEHPLVLFADDLQWADPPSLELLSDVLGDPQVRHVLLVGAYRYHDVGADHPLHRWCVALERSAACTSIKLAPLGRDQVAMLLADTLGCDAASAMPLAEAVHAKSGGNPFFLLQFVGALHQDGLITFDPEPRRWRWRLADLAARKFTDNVVELMLEQMRQLPEATREGLALAALLGREFGRRALAHVAQCDADQVDDMLRPALELDLLSGSGERFRFSHDRIQEAAYALTPPERRAATHWRIAVLLQDALTPEELDEACVDVADHYLAGMAEAAAAADPQRRRQAAELNLRAAERALTAIAYATAVRHLDAGLAMLGGLQDAAAAQLSFRLRLARAKAAWLLGDFARAERLVEELQRDVSDDLDWAEVARIGIAMSVSRHDYSSALAFGRDCLQRLGIDTPRKADLDTIRALYDEHRARLGERSVESLADLPLTHDPRHIAALRVMRSINSITYFTDRDLWAVLCCQMVLLSQRHGVSDASVSGFAVFSFMVSLYFRDHRNAYRYSEVAMELCSRHGTAHNLSEVRFHRALVCSWLLPLREVLALERASLPGYYEVGDRVQASVVAHRIVLDATIQGEPLAAIEAEADRFLVIAQQARLAQSVDLLTMRRQHVRSLRGLTKRLGGFDDDHFRSAAFLAGTPERPRTPFVACWFHVAQLAAHCIAGDHAAGFASARLADPMMPDTVGGLLSAYDYHCYDAVCAAALCDDAPAAERPALIERVQRHAAKLAEWAELNPATFDPGWRIVEAERARIEQRPMQAIALYQQAADSARTHGFVQIEALAHEQSARFYARAGARAMADAALALARAAYLRWGADGKVRQIDASYPHLALAGVPIAPPGLAQLDALAIVTAAQAIAASTSTTELQTALMTVVLQHSGAQVGALLLADGVACGWPRPPAATARASKWRCRPRRRTMRSGRPGCRSASPTTSGAARNG